MVAAATGAAVVEPQPPAADAGGVETTAGAIGSGLVPAAGVTKWRLDSPRYRSRGDAAAAADHVVAARVVELLATGPESAVLGGGSPLPVQIWRAVAHPVASEGPGIRAFAVAVPDPAVVHRVPRLAAGERVWLALRCGNARFDSLRVCSPVGAGDGVRLQTNRRRR